MEPYYIPIEDCLPLCEGKAGRRSIVQLILHAATGQDVLVPASDQDVLVDEEAMLDDVKGSDVVTSPQVQPNEDDMALEAKQDDEVTWYSVYDQPTISILAKTPEYEPRSLMFDN